MCARSTGGSSATSTTGRGRSGWSASPRGACSNTYRHSCIAAERSGAGEAEYGGEVSAHDAEQLALGNGWQAHRGRLLVHGHELVPQLDRIVEETGVVS